MVDKRHFKGKNPYTDRREFKSKEIKKSLVHRARLRKNYFKLLKNEGIDKDTPNLEEQEDQDLSDPQKENQDGHKQGSRLDKKQKAVNFAERARIAKERKEQNREAKLKSIQNRRETIERKSKEREKRKDTMSKRTKTGQPLMGPRINNLLDKIKKDIE